MRFSLSPAPASVKKSLEKISSILMIMHFRTMWYQALPHNTFYQAVNTPRPFWITAWWAWVKMPFGVSLWCNAWWNILPITFFHIILPPPPNTHSINSARVLEYQAMRKKQCQIFHRLTVAGKCPNICQVWNTSTSWLLEYLLAEF